jgi:heptosyltransferase II
MFHLVKTAARGPAGAARQVFTEEVGREIRAEKVARVVVRGANWVGDAVMTVPALRELRRVLPGAHLTLATRPWAVGVFDGADFLDDLLIIEGRGAAGAWRQARAWRGRRFDLAILFPNAFAPAFVAALARVPARMGYATEGRALLLTHALPVPQWRGHRHEAFYYLNLVSELERRLVGGGRRARPQEESNEGAPEGVNAAPRAQLQVSDGRRGAAREFLHDQGLDMGRPLVALCPGSTNSRAKRWPAERFAALADLLAEGAGAQVLLVGSAEETEVSAAVVAASRRRPLDLTGRTSLAESTALLSICDLLVTNDTGPAHLADAVGCPVIVIFGPTDPVTTRPFSERAVVVRRPPACAPCMLRDCPIDHRCMTAISPTDVFAEAARLLAGRSAPVGAAR